MACAILSTRPLKMADRRKRPIFITSQRYTLQETHNEWAKTALNAQPCSSTQSQCSSSLEAGQQDSKTSQQTNQIRSQKQHSQTRASAIILLSVLIISDTLVASVIGQQPLPTVIVRGFLNYRTTVDGTVLLFTPDAGQSQASPASAAIQPSSSVIAIEPTSRTAATFFTERPLPSQLDNADPIEPTSVLLVASSSTTVRNGLTGPVAHPDSDAANDEWRPVQATPPLRTESRGIQPASFKRPVTETPVSAAPSVQADDLEAKFDPDSSTATASSSTTARPKRPSLGFSGQSLARGSTSTFQSRFKSGNSSSSSSSINGIRRPGLSGQPAQTTVAPSSAGSQQAANADSSANAANAFQSRLANANNRLRNRQKHRLPFSPSIPVANSSNANPSVNLLPDGALDVASSVDQPTQQQAGHLLQPERPISVSSQSGGGGGGGAAAAPVVGSDEVPTGANGGGELQSSHNNEAARSVVSSEADLSLEPINPEQEAGLSALSRAGELRPSSLRSSGHTENDEQSRPKLLSGGLQQGALSSGSMSFDALFQNDQPASSAGGENARPSQEHPALVRPNGSSLHKPKHHHHHHHHHSTPNNNEKLNGWLGQHHNKFVARPSSKPNEPAAGHLSSQLAAQLNQLAPTPTQINPSSASSAASNQTSPAATSLSNSTEVAPSAAAANVLTATLEPNPDSVVDQDIQQSNGPVNLQTITKTYSTLLSASKTRLVPLQVNSSTAIYTITENYVLTKLMTAYQTMPAGEFLLPELSTRSPFDIFDKTPLDAQTQNQAPPPAAAPAVPAVSAGPVDTQEQPISLDSSPKSANNWLHDFTSNQEQSGVNQLLADPFQQTSEQQLQQQQNMLALLEQQASQANLAQLTGGNPDLEQLASQLDPAALLADGSINIPDLNNPLVLAAAIQNPQLAALLLAAQQVRLKQRANLKPGQQLPAGMGQSALQLQLKALQLQQQQQQQQQQPSISTSFSTVVRPSTYTARDTMYTTRLVSFRDGRTVRTRTVSEPGSVVEQVLTTTVTETIPVTVTIKPTGVLALSNGATAMPGAGLQASPSQLASNQAAINNALFATQLANLLAARRQQQQLQTSFQSPALTGLNSGLSAASNNGATPQQLLGLQQLFSQQQKRQQQQPGVSNQQFQPNLQQLLQSFQSGAGTNSTTPTSGADQAQQAAQNQLKADQLATSNQQTPALAQAPKSIVLSSPVSFGPITTTLTSLQVRTYTVHNAFKTIFRTITSTVLIPTVLPTG